MLNKTAYDLGRQDARDGERFCPEAYYVGESCLNYAEGFLSVQPTNKFALHYMGYDKNDMQSLLDALYEDDLAVDEAQATPAWYDC